MPRIDLITPVKYNSLWPYHAHYDNLPINCLETKIELVNLAVDQQESILESAAGSTGSLSSRLNQSIKSDGNLRDDAVDQCLHLIGAHSDGEYMGTNYVRMTIEERDKLNLISDESTALKIQFPTLSTTVLFADETVEFIDSDSVTWNVTSPNKVSAQFAFPDSAAHSHHYDLVPVHSNLSTPDYINYKSTSVATPFIDGSLRVYVNGIKLSQNDEIYVYTASSGPTGSWILTSFTTDAENGLFALNRAIDATDIIIVDFDTSYI